MTIPQVASYPLPTAAELPPSRASFTLAPARAALLIHDMQQYFLDYYGSDQEPLRSLLANVARLQALCRAQGIPIYYTAQPNDTSAEQRGLLMDVWGPGLPARPERAPLHDAVAPLSGDVVLRKHRYSAFFNTDLAQQLTAAGRDQLWICGVYAHIGCLTTAVDAFMRDVQPVFIADAVADFSRPQHDLALSFVASCCGCVTVSSEVERALQGASQRTSAEQGSQLGGAIGASGALAVSAAVRTELADLLQVPADSIDSCAELAALGLDSLRFMELGERLEARGLVVDPIGLMEVVTFEALVAGLCEHNKLAFDDSTESGVSYE